MKRTCKKIFASALAVCLLCACIPFCAHAADACGEHVFRRYDPDTDTLVIYGSGATFDFDPEAQSVQDTYSRVVIEAGVTHIGAYFLEGDTIGELVLPDGALTIDEDAFNSCTIERVTFPQTATDATQYGFGSEYSNFGNSIVYELDLGGLNGFPSGFRFGSVGKPLKHLQVKIGENNEVMVKGDSVFRGYHNMPELNAEIFTDDGFFKTGDQGSIDENGFLSLTGRIKELLKTSTGKYVSPNPIELEISRHPLVEQALVIANNRKFASALIWINPEGARRLLRISKEDFRMDLALKSLRVRESVFRHITRINRKLNHWEKICRWVLIGDELTIESGLLTPTLKIRRKVAEERYADKIEGMYTTTNP